MATATASGCEAFVTELWNRGLLSDAQLQAGQTFIRVNPKATPREVADVLVERSFVTRFQADRTLTGRADELILGGYTLVDVVGSPKDKVYKAVGKYKNDFYTVKLLPEARAVNFAKMAKKLSVFGEFRNSAVVPLVRVGSVNGRNYLIWPQTAGGETLEALVQRQKRLRPTQAVNCAVQIAEALQACHEKGFAHGLLRPSAVALGVDGKVRLLDIGIGFLLALHQEESVLDTITSANHLATGMDCASPECLLDTTQRTPAGDQYSLGCVLYFCLTGQFPFPNGTLVQKMMAHQMEEAEPVRQLAPDVPKELVAVVQRLMSKAPGDRYADMAEVIGALQGNAPKKQGPSASKPIRVEAVPQAKASAAVVVTPPPRLWGGISPWVWAAVFAAVAIAGVPFWLLLH